MDRNRQSYRPKQRVTRAKGGEHSSFGVTFASFLLKFGLYEEALELPGNFFDATSKYSSKTMKNRGSGTPLDLPWQAFGFTLHAQLSLGGLCLGFLSTLGLLYAEKLDLAISMPLSSGIAVCAGPGVRVGATWSRKSRPSGPKWLRSAKSEWPRPSSWAGRFGLAVRVMERIGTQPRLKSSQRSKSI